MLKFRVVSLLLFFGLLAPAGVKSEAATPIPDSKMDAVYRWIVASQNPTGLVSTREGKEGICFTYDQALSVFAFILFDDLERASKVLNFFKEEYQSQMVKGRFTGFVDMYFSTGASGAVYRAVGPNAWLLNAINAYSYRTQDLQFLPLAEGIAEWIIALQAIDGGAMGGFHPNLHWISTEHNLDAYCALRNLYAFTKKPVYARKAEELRIWLENVAWIPEEKRFGNGKDDPNFALDVSSWAVLAFGSKYQNTLRFAEQTCQNKKTYTILQKEVEGFDFGGAYVGTFYPDKDAVWFEGTGQMALAYQVVGEKDKAEYFLNQVEQCLTPSPIHLETLGLPYASNPGTPPYGGWQMTDTPLCLSSAAWYLFAKKSYNPFHLGGKLIADEKELGWPVAGVQPENHRDKQFVPAVDDFEHSIAQFLTSYPVSKTESTHCIFQRGLEFNEKKEGLQSLRLVFIPRGITGIQGEFAQNELYAFGALSSEKFQILKTSSQPEFKIEEPEVKEEKEVMPAAPTAKQPAQALMRRQFMTPQNWAGKIELRLSLFHDNSPNLFFIAVKDGEGRLWFSKEISLEGNGWQDHSLQFQNDFRLLETGAAPAPFQGEKVTELWLGIRSSGLATESVVYLDEIRLE